MYLSQSLLLILGEYIDTNVDNLKKKFPETLKILKFFTTCPKNLSEI